MTVLLDGDLFVFASNWIPNSGDNINKPPSVLFLATQQPDQSMLVHNALNADFGGALVSRTRPVPEEDGQLLNYLAWRLSFRFDAATYENLARHELDIKVCIKTRPNSSTKIPNVCNFSTQWNRDSNQVQLDHDPPAWVDSGFAPSRLATAPGVWHTMDYRYTYDVEALTFSILSIQWDDEFYPVPAEHQNVPNSQTNWEMCTKHQIQNEGYKPGTVLIDYQDGVMAWSDQPITGPFPTCEVYDDPEVGKKWHHRRKTFKRPDESDWTILGQERGNR